MLKNIVKNFLIYESFTDKERNKLMIDKIPRTILKTILALFEIARFVLLYSKNFILSPMTPPKPKL